MEEIQQALQHMQLQQLNEFNLISTIFRLILAMILGGLIGIERQNKTRSAGFRTHSLLSLGAALVMLTGHYIQAEFGVDYDISRLGAQVISGIGFIGAGAIINSGTQKVAGLTTAAALWACACIGLAVGIGFYEGAIAACLLAYILLRTLKIVNKTARKKEHFVDIYIELYHGSKISELVEYLSRDDMHLIALNSCAAKVKSNEIGVMITILVIGKKDSSEIIKQIEEIDYVSIAHKVYL